MRYEVLPISKNDRWSGVGERWKVTKGGTNWGFFKRKVDAIRFVVSIARSMLNAKSELSTLKIKGMDGKIKDERTYGEDPRKTRG